jgi:hypothetical protein
MKGSDFAKAAGVALALIAANFVLGFVAVLVYSLAIDPGHPAEHYQQPAQRIVPWVVGSAAPLLFGLAGYLSARRRPGRNAYLYAGLFWFFYVALDGGASALMGQLRAVLTLNLALLLLLDLAGALVGAWLGSGRAVERPVQGPLH